MLYKTLLNTTLLLGVTLNLFAQDVYTVDELIIKSLQNSPNIKISKLNYDASTKKYDISYSNYLPKVDLNAGLDKISQSDIPANSNNMKDDELLFGSLSLKQILYDFGKTGGDVQTSLYNSKSYSMKNKQDISDKKRDVKVAYYQVLKAMALIDVQKENVKLNKAQLYRSKRYFEAGIRTKIDVSDAKVTLIQAKIDLKNAQYNLKLAYSNLDKIVGFETPEREYVIYNQKLQLDSLYSSIKDYDLNLREAVLYAYEHKYELKQQKYTISASKEQITQAEGKYYPSLYLLADYTKQHTQKFNAVLPEDAWKIGVNLNWNLYEGGASDANTQEKKIQADIANAQLHDTYLKIKKETTNAYINVEKSKDALELSQSLVEVSDEKFDQAKKRYEHGLSDYIELQEARQGYIDAKATLVIDYYDYHIATAYLDNAIGR